MAAIVGVAFDQVARTHLVGLAGSLFVVAVGLTLWIATRDPSPPSNDEPKADSSGTWQIGRAGWIALAIGLAPWLSIRTSPWLVVPSLIAASVLVILATAPKGASLLTFPAIAVRVGAVVRASVDTPMEIGQAVVAASPDGVAEQAKRSFLGLTIGITLAAVVLGLLMSGDAFFASVLSDTSVGDRVGDLVLIAVAAFAWFVLILPSRRAAHDDSDRLRAQPTSAKVASTSMGSLDPESFGEREVALILGPIALVLGGYVVSLIAGAVGGAAYVERRTGLTYAEYARSGFFQLVAVVVFVGSLLVASRRIIQGAKSRRRLLVLAVSNAAFTLVMVVVSIARLQTYRSVFGLTMLRFSTTVFAVWLAIVMVLIVAVLLRPRWEPMMVTAVIISAYGTLIATNLANPEAIVARENVARVNWSNPINDLERGAFDPEYLVHDLSDDSVPALIEGLDKLPETQRSALTIRLCELDRINDGWSWNHSRTTADHLLNELCD